MKIGILNNLRAGQSGKTVSRVLSLLRAYPDVMHVETDHAAALPEALADFARNGIDLLVVNGGDGTLQHALTEILGGRRFRADSDDRSAARRPDQHDGARPRARSATRSRAWLRCSRRCARGGWRERMVRRPVLRVAYHRGFSVQYGMFFGAGMIHRAIALTHRLFPKGRNHGVLGPGLVTASLIGKTLLRPRNGVLAPDKVQMLLDGESVPQGEFRLVIASSLNRLFLRMNPFWGEGNGPVRFTCAASGAQHFREGRRSGSCAAVPSRSSRPRPAIRARTSSAPSCASTAASRSTARSSPRGRMRRSP